MDHRLVEYSFSLPWDSKIRNGYTKSILRDAAKKFVPHEVIFRKNKIGFGSPMLHLFKNDWREYLQDLVHENSFNQSQTLSDPRYVRNKILAILENENASFADAQRTFQLVVPYIWEKKVIKEKFDLL
jgi:asparagine synthase (glutamine-hydrolysing)